MRYACLQVQSTSNSSTPCLLLLCGLRLDQVGLQADFGEHSLIDAGVLCIFLVMQLQRHRLGSTQVPSGTSCRL